MLYNIVEHCYGVGAKGAEIIFQIRPFVRFFFFPKNFLSSIELKFLYVIGVVKPFIKMYNTCRLMVWLRLY